MHSPHLVHLARNLSSASAPGGLIRDGSETFLYPSERNIGAATAPTAREVMTPRLPTSIGRSSGLSRPTKCTASSGHTLRQSRHSMHSLLLTDLKSLPIAPIRQSRSHFPQEIQESPTRLRVRPKRPRRPSRAPSGQRFLHQKRFWKYSAAIISRNIEPTSAARRNCGCSNARK